MTLRPSLAHEASTTLGWLDCVNCAVTDCTGALLLVTCAACDTLSRLPTFVRHRRLHKTCENGTCSAKMVFSSGLQLTQLTEPRIEGGATRGRSSGQTDVLEADLQAFRRRSVKDQPIKEGMPLPDLGKCKHFKKSRRWLRFSCCGKAYPCPTCHELGGCPAAVFGIMANRMICGQCSREQDFSNGVQSIVQQLADTWCCKPLIFINMVQVSASLVDSTCVSLVQPNTGIQRRNEQNCPRKTRKNMRGQIRPKPRKMLPPRV